jgi:hypothetical protein
MQLKMSSLNHHVIKASEQGCYKCIRLKQTLGSLKAYQTLSSIFTHIEPDK